MLEFPKDARDTTEREYWPKVEKYYPSYKKFWEKFIGVRTDDQSLRPYGLKIKGVPVNYDSNKYKKYSGMCMRHYSIFCDIASAIEEIAEMKKALQSGTGQEHWRHFENIYFRIGSIFDRFKGMWNTANSLFKHNHLDKSFTKLQDYNYDNDAELQKNYERFQKEVVEIVRGNVIHFARQGSVVSGGKFRVPKKIEKNNLWYSFANLPENELIETLTRVKQDCKRVFEWLEPLEDRLIGLIDTALQSSDVSIDCEAGEPNTPQGYLPCNDPIQIVPNPASGVQEFKNSTPSGCNWSCEAGVDDYPENDKGKGPEESDE